MPRFHFDVHNGMDHLDPAGEDLPDVPAARAEALRYAAELLKEMPETFWSGEQWMITVSDRARSALFSLTIHATEAPPLRQIGARTR